MASFAERSLMLRSAEVTISLPVAPYIHTTPIPQHLRPVGCEYEPLTG